MRKYELLQNFQRQAFIVDIILPYKFIFSAFIMSKMDHKVFTCGKGLVLK